MNNITVNVPYDEFRGMEEKIDELLKENIAMRKEMLGKYSADYYSEYAYDMAAKAERGVAKEDVDSQPVRRLNEFFEKIIRKKGE